MGWDEVMCVFFSCGGVWEMGNFVVLLEQARSSELVMRRNQLIQPHNLPNSALNSLTHSYPTQTLGI